MILAYGTMYCATSRLTLGEVYLTFFAVSMGNNNNNGLFAVPGNGKRASLSHIAMSRRCFRLPIRDIIYFRGSGHLLLWVHQVDT